ncbi:MAG: MFS transporter [Flavobacteriales bacterium]
MSNVTIDHTAAEHASMKGNKKMQRAWTMYDWANSTYNLVIGTAIFPIFYTAVTTKHKFEGKAAEDEVLFFGHIFKNTEVLSYTLAVGMAIVCILAPMLSGLANYMGRKKFFMQIFCYLGSISCISLFFFDMNHLEASMLSVVFACIGFWVSYAFSNSFLPELAEPADQDKLSAKGYSMGYIGSVILLIINLIMIQVLKIDAQWSFICVGIWWAGFAQITFRTLKEKHTGNGFSKDVLANGFKELRHVWKEMNQTSRLRRYLIAFFIFSMGVQTIMQMASLFGTKEVWQMDPETGQMTRGLKSGQLIMAVLMVQVIAIPGAFFFSFLSKKLGNLLTLKLALVVWAGICIFAYALVETPITFYIAAASIGFVMGGTQSLARSTYSKFLPETNDHASYFSFYDVTEKVGLIIGLLSFGFLEGFGGSMRVSILALITFFIAGYLAVLMVPKKEVEVKGKSFPV